MESPNIAQLPTELILKITECMVPEDILRLAKSCHRLAAISAPVYLAAKGNSDPGEDCMIRPSRRGYADELTALIIGFPKLVSVTKFVCVLSNDQAFHQYENPPAGPPIEALTWNIRRLCHFLGRLSSIGSVCLVFHSMGARWSLRSETVQQFTISFLQLLDIIMKRSCTSLHILHNHPIAFQANYQFQGVPASKKLLWEKTKHLFTGGLPLTPKDLRGECWRYSKKYTSAIPLARPPVLSQSKLTRLNLNSDFLLVPPFSPWTFGVLKSSPITSLTLLLPRNISTEEFRHYIFPRLVSALPRLQEFKFAYFQYGVLDMVVGDLPLFPQLRQIVLGDLYHGTFPLDGFNRGHATLPNLTSFTGSADQAVHLFGQPFAFPSLQSISIVIDSQLEHVSHCTAMAAQFSLLNDCFYALGIKPCLSVRIPHTAGRSKFIHATPMVSSEEPFWTTHFQQVSRLNVELNSHPRDLWEYQTEIDYSSGFVLNWLRIFRWVTSFTLTCRRFHPSSATPALRSTEILAVINSEYPGVKSLNSVDVPYNFSRHWTSAGEEWDGDVLYKSCVCSEF